MLYVRTYVRMYVLCSRFGDMVPPSPCGCGSWVGPVGSNVSKMYVCMYVCMSVCIYLSIYLCIYVSMYLCIYVCMYVSMYVCMYICNVM